MFSFQIFQRNTDAHMCETEGVGFNHRPRTVRVAVLILACQAWAPSSLLWAQPSFRGWVSGIQGVPILQMREFTFTDIVLLQWGHPSVVPLLLWLPPFKPTLRETKPWLGRFSPRSGFVLLPTQYLTNKTFLCHPFHVIKECQTDLMRNRFFSPQLYWGMSDK